MLPGSQVLAPLDFRETTPPTYARFMFESCKSSTALLGGFAKGVATSVPDCVAGISPASVLKDLDLQTIDRFGFRYVGNTQGAIPG
jgi:hypothetical protein